MGCCCGGNTSECCPGRDVPQYADVWITADPTQACNGATGVLEWTAGACPVEGDPNRSGYVGEFSVGGDTLRMVVCCSGDADPGSCAEGETPIAWEATFSLCGGDPTEQSSTECDCCSVFEFNDPPIGGCGGCVTTAEHTPVVFFQPRCDDTGSGMMAPPPAASRAIAGPAAPPPSDPGHGPGTELKTLLGSIGVKSSETCGCDAMARKMDGWGVAGCRDRRETIVDWVRQKSRTLKWRDKFRLAASAAAQGMTFINPADLAGSFVDEAVRRADVKSRTPPDVLPTGEPA